MNGTFAFIAGYTSGGAPYGVIWEQVGIAPELPFEEKVRIYREQLTTKNEIQLDETDVFTNIGRKRPPSRRNKATVSEK